MRGESSDRLKLAPIMRTTWNGSLSFGLVSIPVGLAPATTASARQSDVQFKMLHRECLTPIRQKRWCPVHNVELALTRSCAAGRSRRASTSRSRTRSSRRSRTMRPRARSRSRASFLPPRSTPSTSIAPTISCPRASRRSDGPTRCSPRRCARRGFPRSARSSSPARRSSASSVPGARRLRSRRCLSPTTSRAGRRSTKLVADICAPRGARSRPQIIAALEGTFEPSELKSGYRASLRGLLQAKLEGRDPLETEPAGRGHPHRPDGSARASVAATKAKPRKARRERQAHRSTRVGDASPQQARVPSPQAAVASQCLTETLSIAVNSAWNSVLSILPL